MSKERLEEIDDLVDILYVDKIEIREFVRKSLDKDNTINSMAHIIKVKNKEMRELSDFLKERNIPLKELSPLVTIMSYVRELEKDYEYLSHHYGLETDQNQRYKQALEQVWEMTKESIMDGRIYIVVDKALKGESE